jgi:hypothetical protein
MTTRRTPPAAAPRRAPRAHAARAAAGPSARTGPARPAPRGLGVDHHAAHAAGRAGSALALQRRARRALAALGAALAVGVAFRLRLRRRLRLGLGLLGASGLLLGALALLEALTGALGGRPVEAHAGLLRRARLGGRLAVRRLRRRLAGQRALGLVLVDRRRGRLDVQAIRVQALQDLRLGHVVLLG